MKSLKALAFLFISILIEREILALELSLGPGFSLYNQNSFDDFDNIKQYNIEFNLYLKKNFINSFWVRLGAHVNYSIKSNFKSYSSSIHIERKDLRNFYSLGISYKNYLEPSISYAVGFNLKKLNLKTEAYITEENNPYPINQYLLYQQIQFGLSFPIFNQILILTPFYRLLFIRNDKTFNNSYGLEVVYKFL
jgi:hypothetical protein